MVSLRGKTYITTCARDKADRIKSLLDPYGATVFNFPMIEIEPADDNSPLIAETLKGVESFDWIIFSSTNGVKYFFYWLYNLSLPVDLSHSRFAVIGRATGEALRSKGTEPDYISEHKDSAAYASSLQKILAGTRRRILFPTGNMASENLDTVLGNEHDFTSLVVYNTIRPVLKDHQLQELISADNYEMILFLSPSAVKSFAETIRFPSGLKAAAIGSTTRKALVSRNIEPKFVSPVPNLEVMVNELVKQYESRGT